MDLDQKLHESSSNLPFNSDTSSEVFYSEQPTDAETYWNNYMGQLEEIITLPDLLKEELQGTGLDISAHKTISEPKIAHAIISNGEFERLISTCQSNDVTLNAVVLFAWNEVLNTFGRGEVSVMGVKFSERDFLNQGVSISHYNNTLPIILNHEAISNSSILNCIQILQNTFSGHLQNSYFPLAKLGRDWRNFESIFVFRNNSDINNNKLEEFLEVRCVDDNETIKTYPLFVECIVRKSELNISLTYAAEIFSNAMIERVLNTMIIVLNQISNDITMKKSKLNYLSSEDSNLILRSWNNTSVSFPKDKTMWCLFEEQVANKGKTAIIFEEKQLSYLELYEKAVKLSRGITRLKQGMPNEELRIGLFMNKSEWILISMLGIWRMGGCFCPIDPSFPKDRIEFIVSQTGASVVLANHCHHEYLRSFLPDSTIVCPKKLTEEDISVDDKRLSLSSNSLAYICFTSGSTGSPKGVMIHQQALVNYVYHHINVVKVKSEEVIGNCYNYVFDAFLGLSFIGLANGNSIVIIPDVTLLNPPAFYKAINTQNISYMDLCPSLAQQYDFSFIKTLKILYLGGEHLSESLVRHILKSCPNIILKNSYGPTETTVASHEAIIHDSLQIKIGKPISNIISFVLNEHLNPVPIGVVGELFIGGLGISKGYLNNTAMTNERFITNPFQTEQEKKLNLNSILYRTGDLVKASPDGSLSYIGRSDFMVKINGKRIDLCEIEAVLTQFSTITQATVVVFENKIFAYYVSSNLVQEGTLIDFLKSKLPEFMIPIRYMKLDTFPITITGKLDRNALPIPKYKSEHSKIQPTNEIETQIHQIWSQKLKINSETFGITDSFFKLGGDSITAILVVSMINDVLNTKISVRDIFNFQTIQRIGREILERKVNNTQTKLTAESEILSGDVPMLPIQQWFFDQDFPYPNYWNQAICIQTPKLDEIKLKNAAIKLIQHHDSLRLRFREDSSKKYVQYYDPTALDIEIMKLDVTQEKGENLNEILKKSLTEWQSNFDIELGPTFCIGYVSGLSNGSGQIFIAVHHLFVDVVSWCIICKDLRDLYQGKSLCSKTASYRQWAENIIALRKNKSPPEYEYWNQASFSKLELPLFRNLCSSSTKISKFTQLELMKAGEMYNTDLQDLLLSALSQALYKLTKQSEHSVVIESHGRQEIFPELSLTDTVGWFTSLYPVKLVASNDPLKTIIGTKDSIKKIPRSGIDYGIYCGYDQDLLPNIYFNYLGQQNSGIREDILSWTSSFSDVAEVSHNENTKKLSSILDIVCFFKNNTIYFHCDSKLSEEFTTNLAKLFHVEVTVIVDTLLNLSRTYLTLSDVYIPISESLLNELQINSELEAIYPPNSLQQGFLHHFLSRDPTDDSYLTQLSWKYGVAIDIEKLKLAWIETTKIYPALRSYFAWGNDQVLQIISKCPIIDFRYIENVGLNEILKIRSNDREEYFELSKQPLFRIYIFQEAKNLFHCTFTSHHSILDGWSTSLLLSKVHELYFHQSPQSNVEDTYLATQKFYLENTREVEEYWTSYLSPIEEMITLPDLLKQELQQTGLQISEYKYIKNPQKIDLNIEGEEYEKLKSTCQEYNVTMNSVVHFAWHEVLYAFGRGENSVVGVVFSGRDLPVDGIQSSVGLYINTLPVILNHNLLASGTVLTCIQSLQNAISQHSEHCFIPLSTLVRKGITFESIYVFQNYPNNMDHALKSKFKMHHFEEVEKVGYPLATECIIKDQTLNISLTYAEEIFSGLMIKRVIKTLHLILIQISNDINMKKSELNYLSSEDSTLILRTWNNTSSYFPKNKTIWCLFEEQVAKTPANTAIMFEETKLSYQELYDKAVKLSRGISCLKQTESTESLRIALFMDKSEWVLISMLGIWRIGGCFCPIDPNFPKERILYMISQTGATTVLANHQYHEYLQSLLPQTNIVCPKKLFERNLSADTTSLNVSSDSLAYIYFTSGSTGNPKGVLIHHQAFVNYVYHYINIGKLDSKEIIGNSSTYVFDLFMSVSIIGLGNGNTIVIIPDQTLFNPTKFYETISSHKISYMVLSPSLAQQYDFTYIDTLKTLYLVGEPVPGILVKRIHQSCPDISLRNIYGPTETTVTSHEAIILDVCQIKIGKPISNVISFVLNTNLNPVPIGVVGELFIGGIGVGKGYLNDVDMTKNRFIRNKFQTKQEKDLSINNLLYKTGDLVKASSDGSLTYIGRSDFMVKINGKRIELSEIEIALIQFPSISRACVVVFESLIIAYYSSSILIQERDIVNFLKLKLPEFMIPKRYMRLNSFPVTTTGKLDRKSLPIPTYVSEDSTVQPTNEIEAQIQQIWSQKLKINSETFGITVSFFKLGGDSITAILVVCRINEVLRTNISVRDILKYQTIQRIGREILKRKASNTQIRVFAEKGILTGNVPLLPIQQWFFDQDFPFPNYYNQSFCIWTPKLELGQLKNATKILVQHHDALRLRFKKDKSNKYIQYYDSNALDVELMVLDIYQLQEENVSKVLRKTLNDWQSNFDIELGPTFCIGYVSGFSNGRCQIFIAVHHLFVDVVSWSIICKDLENLYQGKSLSSKSSSYRQWAENIIALGNNKSTPEYQYWKQAFLPKTELPLSDNSYSSSTEIKNFTMLQLKKAGQIYNTDLRDLLLSAFSKALHKLTNQSEHSVVVECHGRQRIFPELSITDTVGWFTALYPVTLVASNDPLKNIIKIKDILRKIPRSGIDYGIYFGYDPNLLPNIYFNYLEQQDFVHCVDESNWTLAHLGDTSHFGNRKGLHVILDTLCFIQNDTVHFHCDTKLSEEFTRNLAKHFHDELVVIVETLLSLSRSYLTSSDLQIQISDSLLKELQANIELEAIYPANSLQQGFLHHYLSRDSMDDSYLMQFSWKYGVPIDIAKLELAWIKTTRIYPALRIYFTWGNDQVLQIISKCPIIDFRYYENVGADEILEILLQDREEYFELSKQPLFRIFIFKETKNLFHCTITAHHSILDGWSISLLLSKVHEVYSHQALQFRTESTYLATQKFYFENETKVEKYWKSYLSSLEEIITLPDLLKEEIQQTGLQISEYKYVKNPRKIDVIIKGEGYEKLKSTCQKYNVTMNSVVHFAWHEVLYAFGRGENSVVGVVFSGRDIPLDGVQTSVGLYVNTLPIILRHKELSNETILTCIRNLQTTFFDHSLHCYVQLSSLVCEGKTFESVYVFQNYPDNMNHVLEKELKMHDFEGEEKIDYPLDVSCIIENQTISISLTYAEEIFCRQFIDRFMKTLRLILIQISSNINRKKSELNYLTSEDSNLILRTWNNTSSSFPKDKTMWCLFKEQVRKTPGKTATIFEDTKLSYLEIYEKAVKLSKSLSFLTQNTLNTKIALFMDKSEWILISMLGIWRIGGYFCVIDTKFPKDRIQFILSQFDAFIVLANNRYYEYLHSFLPQVNVACPKELSEKEIPIVHKKLNLSSDSLAYICFTSGSTGNPKGVLLHHQALANYVYHYNNVVKLNPDEVIGNPYNYVFDAFVGLSFIGLTNGNTIVFLSDQSLFNPKALYKAINTNNISYMELCPSLAQQYDFTHIKTLKRLDLGGEHAPESLKRHILQSCPNIILKNSYGPTETTVASHDYTILDSHQIKIGKPISNVISFVLNKYLNPVPIGVVGELFIGGLGVSKGYLNNAEMTKERFISNKFQTKDENDLNINSVLYKTGDLVKASHDGSLTYIGRSDFMVKINGKRIELNEIEVAMSQFCSISQAAVVIFENRIIAYYVSSSFVQEEDLVNFLKLKLPEFMIPIRYIRLKSFPTTPSGKLNRKALPIPKYVSENSLVQPTNEIETKIHQIWSQKLKIESGTFGITDSFFKLGGDSITAILTVSTINEVLHTKISVRDIFKFQTIQKIGKEILQRKTKNTQTIVITESGTLSGDVPILPIQQWFFDQDFPYPNYWNQASCIRTPKLDLVKLKNAAIKLIQHHDALRLRFKKDKSKNYVQYYDPTALDIEIMQLDIVEQQGNISEVLDGKLTDWQSNFDIEKGPTFCIGYVSGLPNGSAQIFIAVHHLFVDVVSWSILCKDLRDLYQGKSLGSKTASYRQWAEKILSLKENKSTAEYEFWNEAFFHKLELPLSGNWYSSSIEINNFTQFDLRKAGEIYNTDLRDLLLSAFSQTLYKLTNKAEQSVVMESHGRQEIFPELSLNNSVGWFTSLYPVKLVASNDPLKTIRKIQDIMKNIPRSGIDYGIYWDYDQDMLPNIYFNYLGQQNSGSCEDVSDWTLLFDDVGDVSHSENTTRLCSILDIECFVQNGTIHFHCGSRLTEEFTKCLVEYFHIEMVLIVETLLKSLCIHQSPSDISENSFSEIQSRASYPAKVFQPELNNSNIMSFPDFEPFSYIQGGAGSKDTLIFLPPAEGHSDSYKRNIIQTLLRCSSNPNLLLFNNFDLYLETKFGSDFNMSIEELSSEYIRCLRSIQPHGPYNIFGWSFGGVLGLEIARKLSNEEEIINSLTLLDSSYIPPEEMAKIEVKLGSSIEKLMYDKPMEKCYKLFDTRVTLYKAGLPMSNGVNFSTLSNSDKYEALMTKYLVDFTKCNNIDSILPLNSKLRVVTMSNDDHFSWVGNTELLEYIAQNLHAVISGNEWKYSDKFRDEIFIVK